MRNLRTLLFLTAMSGADLTFSQRSPFNGMEVVAPDSTGHFRILIGGHFHGESTNRSGFPAATLLANLDTINGLGADLFLSTGDLFMDPVNDRPRYDRSLFSKLKMPFFNAPGNHDISSGVSGREDAFHVGEMARVEFVVLNTETREGSLGPAQLDRLKGIMDMSDGAVPAHVFILSHRPVWAEDDPEYGPLFADNTRSVMGTNFRKDVYPLLERIAQHAHVYWISGSMGGRAPSSIFFQPHAKNITFIQCAIRDVPRDAVLIADVYPDTVRWKALSLTGQTLLAPEAYDAVWWRAHLGGGEGFNWRLLPYLVKRTVTHQAFWWGAVGMWLLVWLVRRLIRR